jgi:hypothetical protein
MWLLPLQQEAPFSCLSPDLPALSKIKPGRMFLAFGHQLGFVQAPIIA